MTCVFVLFCEGARAQLTLWNIKRWVGLESVTALVRLNSAVGGGDPRRATKPKECARCDGDVGVGGLGIQ